MTIVFSGTQESIRVKNLIHSAVALNEVGPSSPYQLAHAGTERSGFSFGYAQWDLASNAIGRGIFQQILEASQNLTGEQVSEIVTFVEGSTGDPDALVNEFGQSVVDYINDALNSDDGRSVIDNEHINKVDELYSDVSSRISVVSDFDDRMFLKTDTAFVFLADYHNQLDLAGGGKMHRFIQGDNVTFGGGAVEIRDDRLGLDDLLNAYLHTDEATQKIAGLNDLIRRFQNVVAVTGWDGPSDTEEALGLNRVYQDRIVARLDGGSTLALPGFEARVVDPANDFLIREFAQGDDSISNVIVDPDNPNASLDTSADGAVSDLIFGREGDD